MSSLTICNCPQNTLDPTRLHAVSSRPSDQQQKSPTAVHIRQRFKQYLCTEWQSGVLASAMVSIKEVALLQTLLKFGPVTVCKQVINHGT